MFPNQDALQIIITVCFQHI